MPKQIFKQEQETIDTLRRLGWQNVSKLIKDENIRTSTAKQATLFPGHYTTAHNVGDDLLYNQLKEMDDDEFISVYLMEQGYVVDDQVGEGQVKTNLFGLSLKDAELEDAIKDLYTKYGYGLLEKLATL